jgi:hypothetical protein
MKIPTIIRKFENITIETERLDELEVHTKIIHDNIYQALMNMIDYNMLPLTKHYLEQALGNEFIFRTKIRTILKCNKYIWFKPQAKWAVLIVNKLALTHINMLYEQAKERYLTKTRFVQMIQTALLYHM